MTSRRRFCPPGGHGRTDRFEAVREALLETEAVECVFTAANHDLRCYALVSDGDVPTWLAEILDTRCIENYDGRLLTGVEWTPALGETEFALTCAECGNTVTVRKSPLVSVMIPISSAVRHVRPASKHSTNEWKRKQQGRSTSATITFESQVSTGSNLEYHKSKRIE
jgi:hypothetical protein